MFFFFFFEATDSTDTEKHMAEDELEACLACPDEAKANLAAQDGDLTQAMKEETL